MSGLSVEHVVVPIDFSEESIPSIDKALEIAPSAGNVHVIHVLPELNAAEPGVVWQTIDNESRKHHAMLAMKEALDDAKYEGLDMRVEIGDAGHRVADYAKEIGAGLIVLPSHGRRGLSRLLIGSVAERILRLAHCPVLVLRK